VPTFRPDLDSIPTYVPGRPIDEVARELGLTDIAKLASNECPTKPFPEVIDAITAAASEVNRYPEDSAHDLVDALAAHHGLGVDHFWLGLGSTQVINCIALAVGGPGTSAVYAHPSFVMYPISTRIAGAEAIAVPLDAEMRHDLDAMASAIREDTTLVYVCNPNNPTGTYLPGADVAAFIEAVPDRITVVVDEAYHDYVTEPDYDSALPLVHDRDNIIVTRTFSKVYGLAGLRIGYGMGRPDTVAALRKTQVPFSTNSVGQAAAQEALRYDDRVVERAKENAIGRETIESGLAERGIEFWPSQTNFVLMRPAADAAALDAALLRQGVIVRRAGPFIRVSVGTEAENVRFLAALDEATA